MTDTTTADAVVASAAEHLDPSVGWSGLVEITPELAAKWLSYNVHNRNKAKRHGAGLKWAILNSKWLVNGETIKLGTDDQGNPWLVDGQHRLESIVDADRPVFSYVVTGLHDEGEQSVQETVDIGRKRTMSDQLYLRGEKDYNNLAAALRHICRYLDNYDLRPVPVPETPQRLFDILHDHPGVRESIRASSTYLILGMPKSLIAALHYLFGLVSPTDRDDFFEKLHTGANLSEGDPILVLQRWLTRQVEFSTNKPKTYVTAAIAIKAWNAWREGRLVKLLTWKGGASKPERYPVIDGLPDALTRGGPEPTDDAEVAA